MPPEAFESAIRTDGKAVEANLRGFRAGLDAARQSYLTLQADAARTESTGQKREHGVATSLADLERDIVALMSVAARDIVMEGARRLVGYQNITYAQLYIVASPRSASPTSAPAPAENFCARPPAIWRCGCPTKT